MALSTRPSSPR